VKGVAKSLLSNTFGSVCPSNHGGLFARVDILSE
jgi:hypothetical protein